MKKNLRKYERGQAIIIVAFAIVGLVAMVGLVTDTGMLLINYGKLKRGVDAASVAAAQQYRLQGNVLNTAALENAAYNFLQLNDTPGVTSVTVHSCDASDPQRPALCNPIGGDEIDNRKLVEVTASADVRFGFLNVIGIDSTTITATSVGEAATIDLVMIIDTSASMAYETGYEADSAARQVPDSDDDPSVCNTHNDPTANDPLSCQPMNQIKAVALDFLETLYFPYDRVAVITMTSQTAGGSRSPVELLPLTSDKANVVAAISGIKVFEPRTCASDENTNPQSGACLFYDGSGNFLGLPCWMFQAYATDGSGLADPSSCPSSNVGGTMVLAQNALTGSGDPDKQRLDSFWVVVALLGGPANSTDANGSYPNGFCPRNTFYQPEEANGTRGYLYSSPTSSSVALPSGKSQGQCRDMFPTVRHSSSAALVDYTNPFTGPEAQVYPYDADDYARDKADALATTITGSGVTIFTIGLGDQVTTMKFTDASQPTAAGISLLRYIAECAGEGVNDCETPVANPQINHGQYFFAPNSAALSDIFKKIANNIATKISQ